MRYIKAPEYDLEIATLNPRDCIFLAGSISNAQNWQEEILDLGYNKLTDLYHVFNPRRDDFDVSDKTMEKAQITWEHHCINKRCDNILFWFSHETMAPITLFEYGKVLKTHNHSKIFVGVHPNYPRKNDVYIQTELENPHLARRIVSNLKMLAISAAANRYVE